MASHHGETTTRTNLESTEDAPNPAVAPPKRAEDLASRIEAYLAHRFPDMASVRVTSLHRIPGGTSKENLTFTAFWTTGGGESSKSFLLRREVDAGVLDDTSVETEYRVMQALSETTVPVPQMYSLELDPGWLGQPFLLEEHIDGGSSGRALSQDPHRIAVLGDYAQKLAQVHQLDWQGLDLEHLRGWRDAEATARALLSALGHKFRQQRMAPQPIVVALMRWLDENVPTRTTRLCVVHGDPGPGNFLFRASKVVALIDWEMARIGDPMDDLANIARKTHLLNFPFDNELFMAQYLRAGGSAVDPVTLRWYEVFHHVRSAVNCLSGLQAFCDGTGPQLSNAVIGMSIYRRALQRAAQLSDLRREDQHASHSE